MSASTVSCGNCFATFYTKEDLAKHECFPLEAGPVVCQFSCEHNCTLVGHAYEALRFLNQCLDHGIVKSAVEGDPEFSKLLKELSNLHNHLEGRNRE